MYCTKCGKELNDNAVICVNCGVPTRNMAIQTGIQPQLGQEKKLNALGLAGFIVGLLSLWLGAYFLIASIVGLTLSIVGMTKMKNCKSNGFAIAGLIISICSLLFWTFMWLCILLIIILGV